jgi:hypothetical protein
MLLTEPEQIEIPISRIINGNYESAIELAHILLMIEQGIADRDFLRTVETIDLLVELAFLDSREYNNSLERFRADAEGRIKPNGGITPRETVAATKPEQEGES